MTFKRNEIVNDHETSLLVSFNKREIASFCEVYDLNFDKLYYFASRLFHGTTILAEDVVQDIFATIWEKKELTFHSLDHIVHYIYLSIRNRYKDFSIRKERIHRYHNYQSVDEDNFYSYILESETLSAISEAIEMLPAECAKVFKLHIEGWEIKEIAEHLNKSQSTVYNQRREAIEILKKRISSSAFSILVSLL